MMKRMQMVSEDIWKQLEKLKKVKEFMTDTLREP